MKEQDDLKRTEVTRANIYRYKDLLVAAIMLQLDDERVVFRLRFMRLSSAIGAESRPMNEFECK